MEGMIIEQSEPIEMEMEIEEERDLSKRVVVDEDISFEIEEEDETECLTRHRTKPLNQERMNKQKMLSNQREMAREMKAKELAMKSNADLNMELMTVCGLERSEIVSADSENSYILIGKIYSNGVNCVVVKPSDSTILNLENLLFIRQVANNSSSGALIEESVQETGLFAEKTSDFVLLGEVQDVFGQLDDPFYKIKENPFMNRVRQGLLIGLEIFAIQSKMNEITMEDIYRMRQEKKSDASGQKDKETSQGYGFENFSDDETEKTEKRIKDKRGFGSFLGEGQAGKKVLRSKKVKFLSKKSRKYLRNVGPVGKGNFGNSRGNFLGNAELMTRQFSSMGQHNMQFSGSNSGIQKKVFQENGFHYAPDLMHVMTFAQSGNPNILGGLVKKD